MLYHTLIIDDHPTQVETYKAIFNLVVNEDLTLKFYTFYDLEKAYEFVKQDDNAKNIDLVLLDLNLPACPKHNLYSGADLAEIIKQDLPQAKLSFLTSHDEALILYDIYKAFMPQGILVKSDFTGQDLENFFKAILDNREYYTTSFMAAKQKITQSEMFVESTNRKIITKLAEGYPSKDLPEILRLSLSAINKRKSRLKVFFNTENQADSYMVLKARDLGFI